MSKLKERELLKWFKDLYDAAPYVLGGSKDEQAYQQIKEMIQAYAQCQEIKADYMNMIFQRDLLQAQLEKKKPEVTELWIKKMAWDIWNKNFDARVETYSLGTLEEFIKKKVTEAGVKVVKK